MSELSALAQQVVSATRTVSETVHRHVTVTPLDPLRATEDTDATLLLKREHQQKTGSFKVRGALAKLSSLSEDERRRGVITASTGNHGAGFAYALDALGGTGIVCVPEGASPVKVAAIQRYGVEVRVLGEDPAETETLARMLAERERLPYVSPYNDLQVIAGQGTVGEEIVQQAGSRQVDAVVVAVGGGGLISGVAATVKSAWPGVRVIGASPANDAAMAASVRAGRVIEIEAQPTVSDATAGGVEDEAITLPLCTELVDEWVLVEEAQIRSALRLVIDTEHELIEGSAAVAVAAALQAGQGRAGQTIAVVSCGANISSAALAAAIASES